MPPNTGTAVTSATVTSKLPGEVGNKESLKMRRPSAGAGEEGKKEKLEIYYDGYFYDVTDFAKRHPGGNVIKFYTEEGEDATQAIEQFHYRARNKVAVLLKSLNRRPAPPQERGLEQKALTRHEALSSDFKKLFKDLKAEGYFEPDIGHVVLRLWECLAMCVFSVGIFFSVETILAKCLSTMLMGFALSRCGWVMHEGGHGSLTGNPKVDKIIQLWTQCFTMGFSALWWNSQHNRHHAMPQRLHHDVDLATLPFVAFHKRAVGNQKEMNSFFIKYQAFLFSTFDCILGSMRWRFYLHPTYQLKRKAYLELLMGIPSLIFCLHYMGPFYYFQMGYWLSFIMGLNFALSHSHLEVADKPTHWVEYSLTHTVNISSNMFADWWMGYLNYQIEHHLFPTMPEFRQKLISNRVKALAEKYDLPYRVFSYPEACKLVYKNLNQVAHELTHADMFKDEIKDVIA